VYARGSGRALLRGPATSLLAVQPAADNSSVRPVFVAWVLGCLAVVVFVAALFIAHFHVGLRAWLWALSVMAPCAPFLYLALRLFRANRRDAFEDSPEHACAVAALSFGLLGLLLGWVGGTWALSLGPVVAAIAFAYCLREVRDIVDWLDDYIW
jgi:O-antigen/teichoic acid export membrane protein